MTVVDLTNCKQGEGESTTHWVRRVKEIIHSSDKMDAGSAALIMEKNCSFKPLRQKLGRLKHDCKDMGTLMAALVKYADSDSTKDPESDGEKTGKGNRMIVERANSTTRRIKIAISAKRMTTRSLWPMLIHKVTIRGIRVSGLDPAGYTPFFIAYGV